jgi:hypothetical protein
MRTKRRWGWLAAFAFSTVIGASPALSQNADIKFYPIEKFTIVYKHTGMLSGSVTMHLRDFGRRYVEIKDLKMSVGNTVIPQKQRVIVEQAVVTTIDLQKNTATRITNPYYDKFAAAVRGKSGVELGRSFMKAMGGVETAESRNIASASCTVWKIASTGQSLCVTSDGLTLAMDTVMGAMKMSQIATEVKRGDGGPNEAFQLGNIPVKQVTMPKIPGRGGN